MSTDESGDEAPRSQAERAYELIKQRIIRGDYLLGSTISEPDLASSLGMSRTPLREALVRLAHDRMVDLVPRRGMRVKQPTKRDLEEINELLSCLECEAAERLALRRLNAEELTQLDSAIRKMDEALGAEDMGAWAAADFEFHRLLIVLQQNSHLAEVALSLLEKAHRFRLMALPHRDKPLYSNVNHAAVVEAIRRGDAQTAVEIHRSHKRRWSRELGELMPKMNISN